MYLGDIDVTYMFLIILLFLLILANTVCSCCDVPKVYEAMQNKTIKNVVKHELSSLLK